MQPSVQQVRHHVMRKTAATIKLSLALRAKEGRSSRLHEPINYAVATGDDAGFTLPAIDSKAVLKIA
jgi:hypothetical protein